MPNTGLGATIVFSGGITSYAGRIYGISAVEDSVELLDDTALDASGYKEFVPDDLAQAGEVTLDVRWDHKIAPPAIGSVGTAVITFAKGTGSTAATVTGSAIIRRIQRPAQQIGQRQVGQITFQYDGKTGPAYSLES